MKISKIENKTNFGTQNTQEKPKKREIIDVIVDNVKNPRDVNDCVAVPRGIFKAYISLMAGTALMGISSTLPAKYPKTKTGLNIIAGGLNIISAFFFAKPFAIKGLSPTVKKEDLK